MCSYLHYSTIAGGFRVFFSIFKPLFFSYAWLRPSFNFQGVRPSFNLFPSRGSDLVSPGGQTFQGVRPSFNLFPCNVLPERLEWRAWHDDCASSILMRSTM